MNGKDQPLTVDIVGNELVIRIGIDVIKFAAEEMEANQPFDEKLNDFKRLWVITDPLQFAKDVKAELENEEEDGTTPLILLPDKVCLAAIESGSMAVDEAPTGKQRRK